MPPDCRQLSYCEAVREATDECMAADPSVYVMGLGVPDPKAIFGSTAGLQEKYGSERVMDMPLSENAMTGVAIGSALRGMRPILTHQRLDFLLLSLDQIINNAAKWHYMFGGKQSVPIVIRAVIGRGWGQGPQHSQSLQAIFTQIPGLRVIMPATPYDAKGLLITAIEESNPVIMLEHRWLHQTSGAVPEGLYRIPLGQAALKREGQDVTLIGNSYTTLECINAAEALADQGIEADVIDLRSLAPWDRKTVFASVRKTGRVIVTDGACRTGSFAGELVAEITEQCFDSLKLAPRRICHPDVPVPTSPALTANYYPGADSIAQLALELMGQKRRPLVPASDVPHDVPNPAFRGPF